MDSGPRSHFFVFTHIPKCGGMSVHRAIRGAAGGKPFGFRENRDASAAALPPEIRDQVLFLSGHFTWTDPVIKLFRQTPLYMAMVREPVARHVSGYFYQRSKAEGEAAESRRRFLELDLDAFTESLLQRGDMAQLNRQCSFFAPSGKFEDARDVIEKNYTCIASLRSITRIVSFVVSYLSPGTPYTPAPHVNRGRLAKEAMRPELEARLREAMQDDAKLVAWIEQEEDRLFERARAQLAPIADRLLAAPRKRKARDGGDPAAAPRTPLPQAAPVPAQRAASHPYASLEARAFWKTAVAERAPLEIEGLSRAPWRISARDQVATAGSCFAQHISRRLRQVGFGFVDVEPAPPLLAAEHHAAHGYGLYSARYGNIYTSTQLRQLLERAAGTFDPAEKVWEREGRFYDPFRPSIEPNGFATAEEALGAQVSHLAAVRRLVGQADVFVFTLGLTEVWRSRQDGAAYPSCPGTQAGTFDAARHEFVNLTHEQVLADMRAAIGLLRSAKPGMRILLTVSPVPLTATASGEHVLTATTYSKSVLRAVAGQLAAEDPLVAYFPSYEIIAAPVFGGRFYAENRREVLREGVDVVMKHFLADFCEGVAEANPDRLAAKEQRQAERRAARRASKGGADQEAVVCDEQILEFYAT